MLGSLITGGTFQKMNFKLRSTKIHRNIIRLVNLKKFFQRFNLKWTNFLIPTLLLIATAAFEGLTTVLLIPLVKGIVQMDFSFIKETAVFETLATKFTQMPFIYSNSSMFIALSLIIFGASFLKNVFFYLSSIASALQRRKFINNLRKKIFERYLSFGKLYFDRTNQGYLQTVLESLTEMVEKDLYGFHNMLSAIFMLFGYVCIMFFIAWRLTIIAMILFLFLRYISIALIKKTKKISREYTTNQGILSQYIFNILSCMTLTKSYKYEKKESERFGNISNELEKIGFRIDKRVSLFYPLNEMILLIVALTLISVTAFLFVKKKMGDLSSLLVFFYTLKRATGAISVISVFFGRLAEAAGPARAIMKVFDDGNKVFIKDGHRKFTRLKKDIKINHLSFSYDDDLCILKDITFSIEKGEMLALVGETGAGKTTLINLIMRFYDSPPSSIIIDSTDIREFTLESLRQHIALVSQEALLFNDTIRNNLTYGLERQISTEELIEVVKRARLYDFIKDLPYTFYTYIGDRGVRLSGGERQRISIARALLKNADILILDEATSSLDTQTERLIQEAIEEVIKDRTTIVIAHRLSTIRNAHKIAVIEKGTLVEIGTPEELFRKKGKFYQYYEAQKFH